MSDMTDPLAQQAAYLSTLFAPQRSGVIELRLIEEPARGHDHADRSFHDFPEHALLRVPKSLERQWGHGVFVGVCRRQEYNGTKQTIKTAAWLWVDMDAKDFPGGKEEAVKRLQAFPLPPTVVVSSGHGYQGLWNLKMQVSLAQPADQEVFEGYLQRLCEALGGDPSVCEVARVLRVPGTHNVKDPEHPVLAQLLVLEPERRYALADFDAVLSLPNTAAQPVNGNPQGWVAEVLQQLHTGTRGDCHNVFGKVIGRLIHDGWAAQDILTFLAPHVQAASHDDHRFSSHDLETLVRDMCRRYPTQNAFDNKTAPKGVYTAQFDGLVDLVNDNGAVAFLVKAGAQLQVCSQVERDGTLYIPPPKDQIPWVLPRGEEVLRHYQADTDSALYDDLLIYHKGISELPHEEDYDLLAAWDFHTYLLEQFQYTPILWLFAVPERGKSRSGKGIIYVAYRGVYDQSLREANFLRLASHHQASVFFDITHLWKKVQQNQSEDVLLHRFERGGIVSRVLFPDRGPFRDTVRFTVFGATVIATNHGVPEVLQTRALQLNMPDSATPFDTEPTPEAALPLKERLVAFRARHLGIPLPPIPKPAARRLGDLLKPLHQIIRLVRPDREAAFRRLAKSLEKERLTEKADSHDAHVLEAILGLSEAVSKGFLAVKKITEAYNAGQPEREHVSTNTMGWRLKAMGFKKDKTRDGAVIVWDTSQLERLGLTYGVQGPSITPDTSDTHPDEREGTHKNPLEEHEGPV